MKASQRVFVNTVAQYGRTIINMVLSLYTVRLVLQTLGQNDYGIYSLIAGLAAMLSFITNSLVSTTQRFVSFYQGQGDKHKVREVFNNSLIIHIIIGMVIVVVLELITPLLFNGFLNIPNERTEAAKMVYQTVVILLFVALITAPFRALLISHENIVYVSIIDVANGILKVVLVLVMIQIDYDKLKLYAYLMLLIQLIDFFALSVYCYIKYDECIFPKVSMFNMEYAKKLLSYAGWSIYGTGCTIGRQQGIAIVLNKLMGPVVNAAYGIGFQVAGYTNFLSGSLANAISPQIIKAEGAGDRKKALWLSNVTSKMIFMLLAAVCIPCMFEIKPILNWWLDEVPESSSLFCVMVMCTLLCDSISIGLMYINQAIGKIGLYIFSLSTPKLITLPLVIFALKFGYSLQVVALIYIAIELICACLRIFFIHKTAGLDIPDFIKCVLLRELPVALVCVILCWLCTHLMSFQYRFVVTFIIVVPIYLIVAYFIGLTNSEKAVVKDIINTIRHKV